MEICHEMGYHFFDLGRCSVKDEGLRRFKQLWGSREEELPYYYYPEASGVNVLSGRGMKYRLMRLLVRFAPPKVLQGVGALVYRHMG